MVGCGGGGGGGGGFRFVLQFLPYVEHLHLQDSIRPCSKLTTESLRHQLQFYVEEQDPLTHSLGLLFRLYTKFTSVYDRGTIMRALSSIILGFGFSHRQCGTITVFTRPSVITVTVMMVVGAAVSVVTIMMLMVTKSVRMVSMLASKASMVKQELALVAVTINRTIVNTTISSVV